MEIKNILDVSTKDSKTMFSKQNLTVGGMFLFSILASYYFVFIIGMKTFLFFKTFGMSNISAITFIVITALMFILAEIYGCDRYGNFIIKMYYDRKISQFIGWDILRRIFIEGLLIHIICGIIIIKRSYLIDLVFGSRYHPVYSAIIGFTVIIVLLSSFVYLTAISGWAVHKVLAEHQNDSIA